MVPTVLPGTSPGPVSSKIPVLTAKEKKAARGRERLRLEKEGKLEVNSLNSLKSSVTPMDSETDTESVAESTTGDKVVFTAAKADGLDITEEALALEIANFDEN